MKRHIDDKNAERLASGSGELAGYLRHKRRLAKYSLSEQEERIINTLDVTGASALVNLYDKITNAYQYRMRAGKRTRTMTREEISNYVRSANPRLRRAAYVELLSKYDSEKGVIGQIYQNIVQNWADETVKMRGYRSAISARNVGNNLDDRTVDSLLAACRKNAPLFQKFFRTKAKLLRERPKRLRRYDLYAPAAAAAAARTRRKGGAEERRYAYDAAVRMVLDTLGSFSPALGGFARSVISEGHVDSAARRGKRDGAFLQHDIARHNPVHPAELYRAHPGRLHACPRDGARRAQHGGRLPLNSGAARAPAARGDRIKRSRSFCCTTAWTRGCQTGSASESCLRR